MTPEDALNAAVLAAPDDDLPRLVFADWWDENGDPERAELIRVQCALAQPDDIPPDRANELLIRQKVLLLTHDKRWLEPLRRRGGPLFSRRTHAQFRRGFVEVVWMPAAVFLKKGDRLLARCPVRELRLTQVTEGELRLLLAADEPYRLEALDLTDRRLGDSAALLFAQSIPLWSPGKLKRLRLRACGINDTGAGWLADIPAGFAPTELDLGLNPITETGQRLLRRRYGDAVRFA